MPTVNGPITAEPGDYIVRGTKGEFYPVRAEVFAHNYEECYGEAGWPDTTGYSQDCTDATLLGQDYTHSACHDVACACPHHKRKEP